MSLPAALLAHATFFWTVVGLAGPAGTPLPHWLACHAAGAAALLASARWPRWRLSSRQALALIGYATVLALLFWGANFALDALGNAVRTARLAPGQRGGLPLHFWLMPGVGAVGAGAWVGRVPAKGR